VGQQKLFAPILTEQELATQSGVIDAGVRQVGHQLTQAGIAGLADGISKLQAIAALLGKVEAAVADSNAPKPEHTANGYAAAH